MDRYYKVLRTSLTGEKITALIKKRDAFVAMAKELRTKYGFTNVRRWDSHFCDIVAVEFPQQPDMKTWKKWTSKGNFYELRARPVNKEVANDFAALKKLSIRMNEINLCVGIDDDFSTIGYNWSVPNVYLIETDDDHAADLTPDCIEISNIEYANLTKDNE